MTPVERLTHQQALDAVLQELKQDSTVVACLCFGSFARGDYRPGSDIDLLCLTRAPWRERRVRLVGGVTVELFYNPPIQLDRELREAAITRNPATVLLLQESRVLWDGEGISAPLLALADEVHRQGPDPLSAFQILMLRYRLTDLLQDWLDLAGEPGPQRLVEAELLQGMSEAFFDLRRQWRPKTKYRLHEMARLEPETAYHLELGQLQAGLTCVLNPVSGLLEESWSTGRSPVE